MNKKFALLTALLAVEKIDLHAGIFGQKKPYAKLEEDALEKIEEALENKGVDAQKELDSIKNAVEQTVELTKIKAKDSIVETIAELAKTCDAYARSTNRHSIVENNGTEEPTTPQLVGGYLDLNDEHNQYLKQFLK